MAEGPGCIPCPPEPALRLPTCTAPRLFRHRQTHHYWIAACIHKVAKRWRAILNWASHHGPVPLFFLTRTLRDPLPLWRQARIPVVWDSGPK